LKKIHIIAWYQGLARPWQLILAGALTGLSFPPLNLVFFVWIGLIPLIDGWLRSPSPGRSAYEGFLWSLGYLVVVMYWVAFNTGTFWWVAIVSMIAMVLALSVNYILIGWWFGLLQARLGRVALWALPSIWVAVEFLRSFGTLGFPWVTLANAQTSLFLPIQNAEITGIYGLSFWAVLINVLVIELLHAGKKLYPGLILGAAVLLPWFTGWLLLPEAPAPDFRVGVVQPNVNALEKWNPETRQQHFDQLVDMTWAVSRDSPAVVFWPEAATPAYLRKGGRRYLRDIQELLAATRITVVTGMPDYARNPGGGELYYNAVGLIDSLGLRDEQYNKIQLVPFGEYIPLSGLFPFLMNLNLGQGNFTSGQEYSVFRVGGIPFSVGVCYETTFPAINRKFVLAGATFLAGVVNDAWYQTSSGPFQHAAQFRYRAVEFRRPVVRAANTGISLVYDQTGRRIATMPLNKEGNFTAMIAPDTRMTFYARFGDVFAWLNVVAALGLAGYAYRRKLLALLRRNEG